MKKENVADGIPDYKGTLNLPVTEFPMKANLAQREPQILQRWQQLDIYHSMLAARDKDKAFKLCDGPPYANGGIHIGHALNKILKDIVVKSKHLSGYYAPFIPGWDCHGLPIELQVEKKYGKPGTKIDANEFRAKCREYAAAQLDLQRASFKRLGVFADWEHRYATMDYDYEANIIRCLGQIIKNGHLVRGDRPVHWCVYCGSALAEAEVEYADKTSPAIDVAFAVVEPQKLYTLFELDAAQHDLTHTDVVIWTTTPWTLPANQAVALNAELEYVLVKAAGRYLVVASELLPSAMQRMGISEFTVVGTCVGRQLERMLLRHPLYAREVPIVLGAHVTTQTGTGCVHTAPAHGVEDYLVGREYNLEIYNPVDAQGCFIADTPLVGGLHVFKANPEIIKLLEQNGRLLSQHALTHSYPHCWRHKEALIFRATPQWFISMEKNGLRDLALQEIANVQWIPHWGQARIHGMIAMRPDWCISRQRVWGAPLPLLLHNETGELHPRTNELLATVADIVQQRGVEGWFNLAVADLLPAHEAEQYHKVLDTLDVWFDSGAVHYCVVEQRAELQNASGAAVADLYIEGSDQHRGWFQTSLLSSVAMKQHAPYKQVLTHGFTVDAHGRKMSKSLGNVVAPEQVIQTLGADVLRLWVAATDYRAELSVSDEILVRTSDAYRRIRNTARFLLANLHDFDPQQHLVPVEQMLALDQWMLAKTKALHASLLQAYETYDLHVIYQQVHNFCSYDLGSFYLDIIKDRQYTCKTDEIPRRSAQTALFHILESLVRWIAPILSFTAEEMWQYMPGKRAESVFLTTWYQDIPTVVESELTSDKFWQQITQVRNEVYKILESMRQAGTIGSGLEATVVLYAEQQILDALRKLGDELRFVLITSQAQILPLAQATAAASVTGMPGLLVLAEKTHDHKCARCWHRTADVNVDPQHPGLCGRCIENLYAAGEQRVYA